MRWSEKETYLFVRIYVGHENLWNRDLPQYKDKNLKIQAYQSIIKEFKSRSGISLTMDELETKIKSLRSTYHQEVVKISRRSSAEYVFKPTIKWFTLWHKCHKKRNKRIDVSYDTNDGDESDHKLVDEGSEEAITPNNEQTDPFEPQNDDDYVLILKSEPHEVELDEETYTPYKVKRRKHPEISRSMDSSLDTPKDDEFDIYGKYIASQLRKMETQKALRIQLEIQSLISEARITELSTDH